MNLPLDILLKILAYSDEAATFEISLTCRLLSVHAVEKLWTMPSINNIKSLGMLERTLRSSFTFYDYKQWTTGLELDMSSAERECEIIPGRVFSTLSTLSLQTLSLKRLNVIQSNAASFESFLYDQLIKSMVEIRLFQCAPSIISALTKATRTNKGYSLQTLDICECDMGDSQLELLVKFYPKLQHLKLDRCGCFSDQSLLAVAKHCQDIRTLVVTLPSYFVQSNTITLKTIHALTVYCPRLERFICNGQIRIAEYIEKRNQKHSFCIVHSA